MAATGYDWGAWAFAQVDIHGDWDADAGADTAGVIAHNATLISSAAISLDVIAACEVGITLTEDDTGAISDVVTVYILGSADGTNYEETTVGSPWSFTITPVRADTVYKRFSVDPSMYGDFKIAVKNASGQELDTAVKYRTATVPVATAT